MRAAFVYSSAVALCRSLRKYGLYVSAHASEARWRRARDEERATPFCCFAKNGVTPTPALQVAPTRKDKVATRKRQEAITASSMAGAAAVYSGRTLCQQARRARAEPTPSKTLSVLQRNTRALAARRRRQHGAAPTTRRTRMLPCCCLYVIRCAPACQREHAMMIFTHHSDAALRSPMPSSFSSI